MIDELVACFARMRAPDTGSAALQLTTIIVGYRRKMAQMREGNDGSPADLRYLDAVKIEALTTSLPSDEPAFASI